jgi:outer membrane lipoprotein-sorting protein
MRPKTSLPSLALAAAVSLACVATAAQAAGAPSLTAEQIIERNVAARGGLAAWHGVQALTLRGHMDLGGQNNIEAQFVSEMKRPRKLRFELDIRGQKAVQIYDGVHGWKIRPYLNRSDAEPYSPEEEQRAAEMQDLDGALIDYKAKGTKVKLVGTEAVEGHDAYKLELTLKNGSIRHDWVDAKTFLEVKVEGLPRRLDGRWHPVETYYRDYRTVNGLAIPYVLETAVQGVRPPRGVRATHKIIVEKVELNPKTDDMDFVKPQVPASAATSAPATSTAATRAVVATTAAAAGAVVGPDSR